VRAARRFSYDEIAQPESRRSTRGCAIFIEAILSCYWLTVIDRGWASLK
jgi:hypothetical protein